VSRRTSIFAFRNVCDVRRALSGVKRLALLIAIRDHGSVVKEVAAPVQ
jgi:hypothetical protein